jgi:hypothetical protein
MTAIRTPHRTSDRRLAARWDQLAIEARQDASGRGATEMIEAVDAVARALRTDQPPSAEGVEVAAAMLRTASKAIGRLAAGGEDVVAAAARAALAALREAA